MFAFRSLAPTVLVRRIAILVGAAAVAAAAITGDPMDALAGALPGEFGLGAAADATMAGFGWGSTAP
ncbi:hypothetical protein [Actinoplanes sp. DH11]|uniref:hypothetical protein n=1 Tax=Actinoplanes sp. DH11 TaxID=2857011 RepID=UPI001E63E38E|nr:hypothetical protein [Actinoplanes sp. DH11]